MRKFKKPISALLALAMMVGILCVAPFNVFAATVKQVSTGEELATACSEINANGGEYTINLNADISGSVSIEITKSDAVVTVIGNGHTLTSTGNTVVVSSGATVNLGDGQSALTLKSINEVEDPGIIYVLDGGICNMYDKVTVKDHKGNNYLGGGVTVQGSTFHMYGGTIDNCGIDGGSVCYGGGVAVVNDSEFIMDGGTISNCYVKSDYIDSFAPDICYTAMGGGVFVSGGSVFTMNGGTISNCSATNFGGGVAMTLADNEVKLDPNTGEPILDPATQKGYVDQGNPRSKVTINGGTISNNKAKSGAGVFASGYYYSFYKVALASDSDYGTPANPGMYINGGENKNVEISSNKATDMGGGVLAAGLKDTVKAQIYNANISDNTAASGAGVMNYKYWTQLDIDGCIISNNEATSNGGGVMATSNSDGGYTSIKDTTITDNISGDRGAGVYYDINSEIRISGADVIQDNTYDGKLNNLNILSRKKPVIVAGDLTGSQIGLSDPTLWDDDKEDTADNAVSTVRLTNGFKANNPSLIPANAFTSDHESWYVDFGEKYVSSKTEFKYTAQQYNNTLGYSEGYDGNPRDNGEIFIKVPAAKFSNYTENVETLYEELIYQFDNNTHLEKKGDLYLYREYEDDAYFYYNGYPGQIYFDPVNSIYIGVLKWANSCVYVYSAADIEAVHQFQRDGRIHLFASGKVQQFMDRDTDKGILALRVDYYIENFNDNYTETELVYNEPLDFDGLDTKTIYKYNEFGYATTKYVIDKSSEDDGSYDYTSEVRLVRKTTPVKFHTNNPTIEDATARNNELFRVYNPEDGKTYTVEDGTYDLTNYKIPEFYNIPAFAEDDYVFAGWYYDADGDKDGDIPFEFDAAIPANLTDVYAHWIAVGEVSKDGGDAKELPSSMGSTYKGFDLFGVQIRPEAQFDENLGEYYYGGLRFITSISESLLSSVDALSDETVNGNKVEYGFVTASESIMNTVATNPEFNIDTDKYKIQYKGTNVNGVDTTQKIKSDKNFNYVTNVDCTSQYERNNKVYGSNARIKKDHHNYDDYRLATFVVTYQDKAEDMAKNVVARAYMRYYDANGLLRTFYNDYGGTNVYGGCSTSYNTVNEAITGDIKTQVQ